jgi:SDR family mycofactocin-dependent oxidoreductase
MSSLQDKVALVTGAGRGQGRSHAVRLAQGGAHVVALDICAPIESVPYPLSTKTDLDETVSQVEELGRQAIGVVADTREYAGVAAAVQSALDTFGRLDIVVANAAVAPMSIDEHPDVWSDTLAVNITGTQNTIRASAPALIDGGRGGSIVIISSGLGLAGQATESQGALAYIASKHAIIGLMRSHASVLAKHSIRVNSVLPSGVATPMIFNEAMDKYLGTMLPEVVKKNALPVDLMDPIDISNAVAWLVSDEARYVTGATLAVDAGWLNYG